MTGSKPTSNAPAEATVPRREFLRRAWLFLGGLVSLQVLWVGFDLLRPRRRGAADAAPVFVAGPVERFVPGTVTAFPAGKFYLARLEDGGFLALSRTCTHLGCTVPWVAAEDRFACPCHASSFDITGQVLSPPADRALDLFPVRIENAVVKVDLGRSVRRRQFDPAQVVRP